MDRRLFIVAAGSATLFPGRASAHEFVAYFPYGGALLSDVSHRMVRSAAGYAETAVRIRLNGHLDMREAVEFSDELARMRNQAVASELFALGIRPDRIEMISHGAEQLARPTAAGVAEPLNRRVTIGMWLPPRKV